MSSRLRLRLTLRMMTSVLCRSLKPPLLLAPKAFSACSILAMPMSSVRIAPRSGVKRNCRTSPPTV